MNHPYMRTLRILEYVYNRFTAYTAYSGGCVQSYTTHNVYSRGYVQSIQSIPTVDSGECVQSVHSVPSLHSGGCIQSVLSL